MRILLVVAALSLAVTGCATTEPEPTAEPCVGSVRWAAGSMAPPHSHSWELTVADGTADFVVWPTYTEEENFREDGFVVDEDAVGQLCLVLAGMAEDEDEMVGGPMLSWELGESEGFSTIPSNFGEARDHAVGVIGQARFDEGIAAYEAWRDAQGD